VTCYERETDRVSETRHLSLVTCHFLQNGFTGSAGDLRAAVLQVRRASSFQKFEHGLAEGMHDIGAIEIDVFHERAAIVAVENDCSCSPPGGGVRRRCRSYPVDERERALRSAG